MPAVSKSPRHRSPATLHRARSARPQRSGGLQASGSSLDHFREIVAMIDLLDRSPEFADNIRTWRPQNYAQQLVEAPAGGQDGEVLRAYRELSPLTQRAFRAVVAGIDKLAQSAVDLYGDTHKPPTLDEIRAGAAIGRSLSQLLERAMALVDAAGAGDSLALSRKK
jgi:hypothetical protein